MTGLLNERSSQACTLILMAAVRERGNQSLLPEDAVTERR